MRVITMRLDALERMAAKKRATVHTLTSAASISGPTNIAMILSPGGERLSLETGQADGELPAGFSPLRDVAQILVTSEDHDKLQLDLQTGALGAEARENLAKLASKIVKTSDPIADLDVARMSAVIPALRSLPKEAKRPVAALMRACHEFTLANPAQEIGSRVPDALKLELAFSRIRFKRLSWFHHVTGPDVQEFYHGASSRSLLFGGSYLDLGRLWNKLSAPAQTTIATFVEKVFHQKIRVKEAHGHGLYTGNATVAASFAGYKVRSNVRAPRKVYLLGGRLDVGQETTEDLAKARIVDPSIHTRVVEVPPYGYYRATIGGKYIEPTSMTTFDPCSTTPETLAALVKAASYDFEFARAELSALDRAAVRQSLASMVQRGDDLAKPARRLLEGLPAPASWLARIRGMLFEDLAR